MCPVYPRASLFRPSLTPSSLPRSLHSPFWQDNLYRDVSRAFTRFSLVVLNPGYVFLTFVASTRPRVTVIFNVPVFAPHAFQSCLQFARPIPAIFNIQRRLILNGHKNDAIVVNALDKSNKTVYLAGSTVGVERSGFFERTIFVQHNHVVASFLIK